MIYNNLLYLLVVILILATSKAPETPQVPPLLALLLLLLKGLFFQRLARRTFRPRRQTSASRYFAAEQKLSVLAVVFFAIDVYFLDLPYYLARLPLAAHLPVVSSLGGLFLFFCYLALLWLEARPSYELTFGRRHTARSFLLANFKINLSIVLPWLLLSLIFDLLSFVPLPGLKNVMASPWAEPIIFLFFFAILALGFPMLIVRLWNCRPLSTGAARTHIESICRREGLSYREIMLWPLFEGRILTAGIMGLTKRFRYLLITPALLEALNPEEMEAVIAHEIGHVKKYHLQLYLLLFLGFGLLAQLGAYPLLALVLNSELFYTAALEANIDLSAALNTLSLFSLFVFLLLYFRYIFGFFMRNFERQADLHAFTALGDNSYPLIRVLEKIGWLSGNIRDLPSWHHFGIGQRVDFLLKCQRDHRLIARHHLKVYGMLALYLAFLVGGALLLRRLPADLLGDSTREKFAEAVISQKIEQQPDNAFWQQALGDLQQSRRHYRQAIAAYERALALEPNNATTLNNLAWVLLTAEDPQVLDPKRALFLARQAASRQPAGHILDTLATAYWANGLPRRAIRIEQQAIEHDPANRAFYRAQIEKFAEQPWPGRKNLPQRPEGPS